MAKPCAPRIQTWRESGAKQTQKRSSAAARLNMNVFMYKLNRRRYKYFRCCVHVASAGIFSFSPVFAESRHVTIVDIIALLRAAAAARERQESACLVCRPRSHRCREIFILFARSLDAKSGSQIESSALGLFLQQNRRRTHTKCHSAFLNIYEINKFLLFLCCTTCLFFLLRDGCRFFYASLADLNFLLISMRSISLGWCICCFIFADGFV